MTTLVRTLCVFLVSAVLAQSAAAAPIQVGEVNITHIDNWPSSELMMVSVAGANGNIPACTTNSSRFVLLETAARISQTMLVTAAATGKKVAIALDPTNCTSNGFAIIFAITFVN